MFFVLFFFFIFCFGRWSSQACRNYNSCFFRASLSDSLAFLLILVFLLPHQCAILKLNGDCEMCSVDSIREQRDLGLDWLVKQPPWGPSLGWASFMEARSCLWYPYVTSCSPSEVFPGWPWLSGTRTTWRCVAYFPCCPLLHKYCALQTPFLYLEWFYISIGNNLKGYCCDFWMQVDPGTMQFLMSTTMLPMVAKPVYGIISDSVYIKGAHRIPYLVLAGKAMFVCEIWGREYFQPWHVDSPVQECRAFHLS